MCEIGFPRHIYSQGLILTILWPRGHCDPHIIFPGIVSLILSFAVGSIPDVANAQFHSQKLIHSFHYYGRIVVLGFFPCCFFFFFSSQLYKAWVHRIFLMWQRPQLTPGICAMTLGWPPEMHSWAQTDAAHLQQPTHCSHLGAGVSVQINLAKSYFHWIDAPPRKWPQK